MHFGLLKNVVFWLGGGGGEMLNESYVRIGTGSYSNVTEQEKAKRLTQKGRKKNKHLILMGIFLNTVRVPILLHPPDFGGALGSNIGSAEGLGRGLARSGPKWSKKKALHK